jgi:hypothetical protein
MCSMAVFRYADAGVFDVDSYFIIGGFDLESL